MRVEKKEGWFLGRFVVFRITMGKKKLTIRASINGKNRDQLSLNLSELMTVAEKLGVTEIQLEKGCKDAAGYKWKFQQLLSK